METRGIRSTSRMFELQKLQGDGERAISVQTRKGSDVRNSLGLDLTESHRRRYDLLLSRYGQNWQIRRPPSGCYNCAGHVWASRRTCIYEAEDWQLILADDGYRRTNEPVADDLILYVEKDQGILHIGRVLEVRAGITAGSRRIPWVLSKWNDWSGEVCHFEQDHPLRMPGFTVTIEYWTDRPFES